MKHVSVADPIALSMGPIVFQAESDMATSGEFNDKRHRRRLRLCALIGWLTLAFVPLVASQSNAESASSAGTADTQEGPADWPRHFESGNSEFTIYQPQLDTWNGHTLTARAAVAVKADTDKTSTYGVVWIKGRTSVDKVARVVSIDDLSISKIKFPTSPEKTTSYQKVLDKDLHDVARHMTLDRLQTQLEIMHAVEKGDALALQNDPPQIIFSTVPAMLVSIDGDPVFKPVAGSNMSRAINTRVLLLKDHRGRLYLHVFDGWMTAADLNSNWQVEQGTSLELSKAQSEVLKHGNVDLLQGESKNTDKSSGNNTQTDAARQNNSQPPPSLKTKPVPVIHIATQPTELIITDGQADYVPVEGSDLLYVKNTSGNIFREIDNQKSYLNISGRWFTASSNKGPWSFIASKDLPSDFAKIPDDSDKENVKASIAGTSQAKEALIANSIPQTAAVKTADASFSPLRFDGAPQFKPIEDTSLRYVANASGPLIVVSDTAFYSVENGVWFTAAAVTGPWRVATSVPAEIYKIPPSSPLHYLTYVYVYEATADTVYVGYTPGYSGSVVYQDTVVYGTGYHYQPWIGNWWWGWPLTYGYGAGLMYSPWGGWGYGFGYGWGGGFWGGPWGWGWGPHPWWGPWGWHGGYHNHYHGWGPRGRGGAPGNYYSRWNKGVTSHATGLAAHDTSMRTKARAAVFNSRTGQVNAGIRDNARATPQRAEQTPRAARSPNNVYADHDGNVYRRQDSGQWQQHTNQNWNNVNWGNKDINRNTGSGFSGANRGFAAGGGTGGGFQSRGFNGDRAFNARMGGMNRTGGFRRAGGFGGAHMHSFARRR